MAVTDKHMTIGDHLINNLFEVGDDPSKTSIFVAVPMRNQKNPDYNPY